jgi:hypothetical protein
VSHDRITEPSRCADKRTYETEIRFGIFPDPSPFHLEDRILKLPKSQPLPSETRLTSVNNNNIEGRTR